MARWTEYGGKGVDLDAIVAVERGKFNDNQQDWKAVLVHVTGATIEVDAWYKDTIALLMALKR